MRAGVFLRPRRLLLAPALTVLALAVASFFLAARQPAEATAHPDFLLPWQDGQTWLTGSAGFHNANDAIDFFPPDTPLSGSVKCEGDPDWELQVSSYYVLSSAPGVVLQASNAAVLIDHGGGWLSRHYHMTGFIVEPGDFVQAGQRLAKPSTLGFCSSGPHNHFWIQGPNGETTRDVTLSGIPATEIGINEYISDTDNVPPASATPTPLPSLTPTSTPTAGGSPTPTASPPGLLRGDANCDGAVNALDATIVLWIVLGYANWDCGGPTADTDCDGLVSTNDALDILLSVPGIGTIPAEACATPSPTPAPEPENSATPTPTGSPVSR